MSNNEDTPVEVDITSLDLEKLREVARDLKTSLNQTREENKELRNRLSAGGQEFRQLSGGEDDFGSWSTSKWIRAEQDFPEDKSSSWSCLRRKPKVPTVIAFDPRLKKLEACTLDKLEDRRAVFSRIPSRRSRTVYAYIESITTATQTSRPRFRVTTRRRPPNEMIYHSAIHLNRLPAAVKFQILIGKIQWLFILRPYHDAEPHSEPQ